MELREQIARAICGNWVKGDDRPWQQWTEEADAVIEVLAKQKPAAWQRQHRSFGPDAWMETTESVAERLKTEDGWKVRPLYLAPCAQAAVPDGWQPIETAPKDTFLLLRGPSGYTTTPFAYTTGRMCSDYKVGRWIDHRNDDLTDWGFKPTHWMPLPEQPK